MRDKLKKNISRYLLNNIFALLLFLLGSFTLLSNILKQTTIASFLFKISFAVILMWLLFDILFCYLSKAKELKSYSPLKIVHNFFKSCKFILFSSLFLFFIISLFSILISSGFKVSSLNFFNQYLCVFSCLALFYLLTFIKLDKNVFEIMLIINLFVSLVVIALFLSGYARTWHNTTSWVDLNLNFQNPNPAAEYCLITFLFLLGSIFYSKLSIVRILSGIIAPFFFFLMNLTSSRNTYIAIFVSIFLVFLMVVKNKLCKPLICISIFIPIFYIFIIMAFGILADYSETFKNIMENFELYGRYNLWAGYLKGYTSSLMFGCYYLVGSSGSIASLVNSYLMILILFGPISYLLFLFFNSFLLEKFCKQVYLYRFSFLNWFPIFVFLTILFLGLNEGGVYVGAGGLHVVGIFCATIFTQCKKEKRREIIKSDYYLVNI